MSSPCFVSTPFWRRQLVLPRIDPARDQSRLGFLQVYTSTSGTVTR
eukprot:COSAG01_NODE_69689_length_260_cov_1.596273_1_plen_45_part_10